MDFDLSGFHVYEHKVYLRDILTELTREELHSLARTHHMRGYSRLKKDVLISHISEYILQRDIMMNYFLCLNDQEIEYLRMARDYGGVIEDAEPEAFSFLIVGGYAGFTRNLTFAVPHEVLAVFDTFDTPEFDADRRRTMLIGDYSHVANYLYGVTPPIRIVKIFNRYEDKKTDWKEVVGVYRTLSRYRCDFEYLDYFFVDTNFVNNYKDILDSQGNIPYYMPTYEQICWWNEFGFVPDSRDIMELYKYLTLNLWVDEEDALEGCYSVEQIIRVGCSFPELRAQLQALGIECKSKRQARELELILKHLFDHSRMIIYRGFTPEEIRHNCKS